MSIAVNHCNHCTDDSKCTVKIFEKFNKAKLSLVSVKGSNKALNVMREFNDCQILAERLST